MNMAMNDSVVKFTLPTNITDSVPSVYLNETITSSNQGNVGIFKASSLIDTIYIILGTLGMTGNMFVIIVVASGKRMLKKITNLLVLNQSIADFGVSFFLTFTSFDPHFQSHGALSEFLCRFWDTKYPLWSIIVTSTYNLVLITLERYFEIVHPFIHKVSFTRTRAKIAIAIVWLFGPIWQLYFFFVSAVADGETCLVYSLWPSETFRQVFGFFNAFVQFIVPLFVLIYVYARIIFVINNRINVSSATTTTQAVSTVTGEPVTSNSQTTSGRAVKWHGAKKNTMKTMALVAAAFVICWSQNQIYYLMMNLGFPADFSSPYYHFTAVCVFCNCAINPFIYALKYKEFQKAAMSLFQKCCPRLIENRDGDNGSSMTEQSQTNE